MNRAGTYVPILPPSLLDAVEAPTPFLMGCNRAAFLAGEQRLEMEAVLIADLDSGQLRRPDRTELPPSLPRG